MDIEFYILNQTYSFTDCESFDIRQDSTGRWIIEVDGKEVEDSEFAPVRLSVTE